MNTLKEKLMYYFSLVFLFLVVVMFTAIFITFLIWTCFSEPDVHIYQYLISGVGLLGAVISANALIYVKDSKNSKTMILKQR